jgi:hypothetical protein
MQQAKTANLGPAALSTTAAAPPANIWVLRPAAFRIFDSVGKFGSVGNSSAVRLRRRLRQQIRLRRQFGSVGNFAPSVIRLHWRLCPKIWIRSQIWLRWHFIGNSAPSAAPSANSNPSPSAIQLHPQFGCIGGSILGKLNLASWQLS